MPRSSLAAAILLGFVAVSQSAEPKPTSPKHEFYRPDVKLLAKPVALAPLRLSALTPAGLHELVAEEAEMSLPDSSGVRKVRLYCYNSALVGPTIVSTPGATLNIRVVNRLSAKPDDEPPVPGENDYHGFDVTNLHTHGLNVTPGDPGDNVFREIRRGFAHTYSYQIPKDQVPGTYFYHPHKHGSVGYQVTCGMVGALIVKDQTKGFDSMPELRGARDEVLVLQQLDLPQYPKAGVVYTVTPRQFYFEDRNIVTAVNGQVMPVIKLKRKEVLRWRVVHGGVEEVIRVAVGPNSEDPAPKQLPQLLQIAWDGIPLASPVPLQDQQGKSIPLDMYPGNRAEILVQAPDAEGTFILKSAPAPALRTLRGKAVEETPLALIKVEGVADASTQTALPTTDDLTKKAKEVMPSDLSAADVDVNRTFNLVSDDNLVIFQINGKSFDPNKVASVFLLGTREEWTLKASAGPNNTASGHPFHVHVNPFQVVKIDGKPVTQPYWSDTIFLPVGHSATVRTAFRRFGGKTVMHCHILDHEDAGMMHGIFIEDPSIRPDAAGRSAAATDLRVPRTLNLTTLDGGKIDLATDTGTTIMLFFTGPGCPRCLSQLKSVVQARRTWDRGKTRVVAISSDTIKDQDSLRRTIGARTGEPVIFCQDPELKAFKEMGCEEDGPLHGIFAVRNGKIIWKNVGFTAFSDIESVKLLLERDQEVPHTEPR